LRHLYSVLEVFFYLRHFKLDFLHYITLHIYTYLIIRCDVRLQQQAVKKQKRQRLHQPSNQHQKMSHQKNSNRQKAGNSSVSKTKSDCEII